MKDWSRVMLTLLVTTLALNGCEVLSRDKGKLWRIDNRCHATEAINMSCTTTVNRDETVEFGYNKLGGDNTVVTETKTPDGTVVREIETDQEFDGAQ